MRILACPGQGSQRAGFLQSWLQELPRLDETLKDFSTIVGLDLVKLGTEADDELLRNTEIAQPLIVASSIAIARNLPSGLGSFEGVVGHSVGEFAAAAIAGIISDTDAIRLVTIRGRAMARASESPLTGMIAVLGGQEGEILALAEDLEIELANHNGPGQLVLAGRIEALESFQQAPPPGARVMPLKVSGAFHTKFMSAAVAELRAHADQVAVSDPQLRIWSNQSGQLVSSGKEFVGLMIDQIANSVRWDRCLVSISSATAFVELPPAGVLSGIAKRQLPNAMVTALKSPEDLEELKSA